MTFAAENNGNMSDTLTITIPHNNLQERKYILHVLFSEMLGLKTKILVKDVEDYECAIGNGNRVIIKDAFFSRYKEDLSYLRHGALPAAIHYARNDFIAENDIPVIYGTDEIRRDKRSIICNIDIFASSFFMLSRWEEFVIKDRDEHDRFPTRAGAAYKNKFILRPVVNEYVEMLWNMLLSLGFKAERKKSSYELVVTHDVDRLYYRPLAGIMREFLKTRQIKRFIVGLYYYSMRVEPDYAFEYLMSLSERCNVKSRFYFIGGGDGKYEKYYSINDAAVKKLFDKILKRNHMFGFHPSYDTIHNHVQWKKEKENIENKINKKIEEGRQHYLRFENPATWRLWDENGMRIDSTMGFSDYMGFRCGTGNIFPVFDVLSRKMLTLKERPLIIMDSAIKKMGNKHKTYEIMARLKEKSMKYGMTFTILFHNHSMDRTVWNRFRDMYESILGISN